MALVSPAGPFVSSTPHTSALWGVSGHHRPVCVDLARGISSGSPRPMGATPDCGYSEKMGARHGKGQRLGLGSLSLGRGQPGPLREV